MSQSIALVRAQDYDNWLCLWQGYQDFYGIEISPAVTAQTWGRFLDDREPMHAAISHANGLVNGLVHWVYHRSTWTSGDYCYLQDLFVAPNSRKDGFGTALINFVYAHAHQQRAPRVYWLTHKSNEVGISLYRKVAEEPGFIQFRHTP